MRIFLKRILVIIALVCITNSLSAQGLSLTGTVEAVDLTITTSITAAAITTSGGISVGTSLLVSGNLSVVGSVFVPNLQVGNSGINMSGGLTTTGQIQSNGISVNGSIYAAALTTTGGLSVATTAYIGGNLSVVGSSTVTGLVTAQDLTTAGTGSLMVGSGGLFVGSAGITVTGQIQSEGISVNGSIYAGELTLTGDINVSHIRGITAPPSLSIGSGVSGTTTTAILGTDIGGQLTVTGTANGTAARPMLIVTFNRPFTTTPRAIILTPANPTVANLAVNSIVYVGGISTTGFKIISTAAIGNGQYSWFYVVIQ